MKTMSAICYYGESKCSKCKVKTAYYWDNAVLCGFCAKSNPNKQTLPRRTGAELKKIAEVVMRDHMITVCKERQVGKRGTIGFIKRINRVITPLVYGFINVYVSSDVKETGSKVVGLTLPKLSPFNVGPIIHGQPNLPDAQNLENFHQGNKCYKDESDESFMVAQIKLYLDTEAHRHKRKGEIPECSIWRLKTGEIKKCGYVEARQFYCTFYERLIKESESFKQLDSLVGGGFNIAIVGYDAPIKIDWFNDMYLNPNVIFGHELVLACMLVLKGEDYPWVINRTVDF